MKTWGAAYGYHQRITRDLITGEHGRVIMPRVLKAKSVQDASVKDMAEVFLFSSLGHPNSQIFRSLFADFYAINFLPPKKVTKTGQRIFYEFSVETLFCHYGRSVSAGYQ